MFTGVQILEPRVFDYMPPEALPKNSAPPKTLIRMLANEQLFGFRFDGFWQDLGPSNESKRQSKAWPKIRPGCTIFNAA
jgi:NDP-sugar pyrophosphorylase family protein